MDETFKVEISKSQGSVSAQLTLAEQPVALMTLAHGAGAGMHHPFMVNLSTELATHGISTLRFNFPYMERGSRRPDPAPIAEKTIGSIIDKAKELFPQLPIVAAGKSFGGRMTSQLLCKHTFPPVKAIVFYGFPLHPVNNPGTERARHLSTIGLPMLFLQGTRDALARVDLIKTVCDNLVHASLVFMEDADHSFKIKKKDSIVDLAKKTRDWLTTEEIL